ncbi:DnaB-like helicase N-terminal domain-containing protein [Streptomyces sp. YIM 98790]|uniref:DnaB-like helicase N-terminal domain-containing protein n=1 Tax=Streptomyces sp. YIM 98790 TaxID=2689077 RepID=UPI001FB752AD|nr:DnaB-like helicase N-terminal domain-containing protein [Streptomyces sp. YIM 98790]
MKPLHKAEQAVLGAALLEPERVAGLSGWLEPDHFHHPMHQALYAALLKLHRDGHPGMTSAADTATSLSWVNDAVTEAGQHVRGLTSAYAHSLVRACPRPRHAPFYGRMVLEGAIHRRVTEHAIRLHQAARTDAARSEVEDTPALRPGAHRIPHQPPPAMGNRTRLHLTRFHTVPG